MEKDEYYKMFEFETDYWWYGGLHELTRHYVEKFKGDKPREEFRILDAGCGTGRMMELLAPLGVVEGMDHAGEAIALCKKRGVENAHIGDLNTWNPPKEAYDIIVSNDVIYISTIEDDIAVVGKFFQALKEGGILILNLPAFKMLKRNHDIAVLGKRRYRKKPTLRQLQAIGFEVVRATYRMPLLFFIILVQKYGIDRWKRGKAESDFKRLPAFINRILLASIRWENKLIEAGVSMPFGSSLFLVGKKTAPL